MAGSQTHLLTSYAPSTPLHRHPRRASVSSHPLSAHNLLKANGALVAIGYSIAESLPRYVPGFKTSATFLSSLRQNLCMSEAEEEFIKPHSTNITSFSFCGTTMSTTAGQEVQFSQHYPSIATGAIPDDNLLDGVFDSRTVTVENEADRKEALKLITDSVAQQRQHAGRSLLTHPVNLTVFILLLAVVGRVLYSGPGDKAKVFSTFIGLTITYLALVRWIVNPYVSLAKRHVSREWLGEDTIIATKAGDKIIGALVLGWDPSASARNRGRYKKGGKGVVRAWTVLPKYRRNGQGRALLEEAVAVTQQRGGEGLQFEEQGIYSERVLPEFYNGVFDKRDCRAQAALDKVIKSMGNFSKRRYSR